MQDNRKSILFGYLFFRLKKKIRNVLSQNPLPYYIIIFVLNLCDIPNTQLTIPQT